VATWDDVRRLALALPETAEEPTYRDAPAWKVRGKAFVWDRPLAKKDLEELGPAAPDGAVLGVHVADEGVKQALLADDSGAFFTTSHFDGYPAVLVRLDAISTTSLEELVTEAWLARAPKRLAKEYLAQTSSPSR
jgi:hypothetical protein